MLPSQPKKRKGPRFTPHFIRRLSSWLVLSTALTIAVRSASTLYWDTDANATNDSTAGAGLGGSGTWDTTTSNWWSPPNTSLQTWNDTNFDTAVFAGTAGTATLTSSVVAGGLRFNTAGYTITTGANSLSLNAAENEITLNNVANATITGNLGGSGNVTVGGGSFGGNTAGTLTLNGTSAGGWTGKTTVNNGMTIAMAGSNQALLSTTDITLNGGGISVINTNNAEAGLDHLGNSAPIVSNGGTITITNASTITTAAETIGAVTANSGRTSIVSTTALASGTQTLTLSGLAQSAGNGATGTGAGTVAFGIGGFVSGTPSALNSILITGFATTTNTIIGPWATVGTTAANQTDYATYNYSGGTTNAATGVNTGGAAHALGVNGANVTAVTAFPTAATTWNATSNVNLSNGVNTTTLPGNTNINTLRYTGGMATVALGSSNLGTFGVLQAGNGLLTLAGTGSLTLPTAGAGNLYLIDGTGAGIAVNAPVSDNGGALTLVISGQGTVTLGSTSSNYSGGTVVNSGTLRIGSDANLGLAGSGLTYNGSGGLTFSGATTLDRSLALNNGAIATIATGGFANSITGAITGTGGISLSGGGILTLTSTAGAFTGPTIVTGVTLRFAGGALGTTGVTTLNGGVLDLTSGNQAIGDLVIGAGTINSVVVGSGGGLTVGSTITRGSGGSIAFDISAGGASISTTATSPGTNGILGYALVKDSTGSGFAQINGGNIQRFNSDAATPLTASSDNAATDFTTLGNAGTLTWTNAGLLTNRSVNSLTMNATGNSGQVTDMGLGTNVLTLTSGALQYVGTGNATLKGGQIGSSSSPVYIYGEGSGVFTLASTIAGGSGSLIRVDSGTMILSGNNTFVAPVIINGGVLQTGSTGALNAAAPNAVVFGAGSTGVLRLAGTSVAVSSLTTHASTPTAGIVENGSALRGSLTVDTAYALNNSFGGVVQDGSGGGSLSVVKTGFGTLSLTNSANTFSGDLAVYNGTLLVTNAGQLGTGTTPIAVNSFNVYGYTGGQLLVQGGITVNRNLAISGRGPNGQGNGAVMVSSGNNIFGGIINVGNADTRAGFVAGNTVFSVGSVLNIAPVGGNGFIAAGDGNLFIHGLITGGSAGQANFYRYQPGTLNGTTVLTNWNNTYIGDVRQDGGFTRLSNGGVLGLGTSATAMRGSGGTFEIRTDMGSSFAGHNLALDGSQTIYLDRAVGGAGLNQTVTLGTFSFGAINRTLTIAGRDGYNFSIGTIGVNIAGGAGGGNAPISTGTSNGLTTINGNVTIGDSAGARFFVFNTAGGDGVFNGGVLNIAGTLPNNFSKQGAGTLTWNTASAGNASTINGTLRHDQGTLIIGNLANSLGPITTIQFGSLVTSTTTSTLKYTGTGETLSKMLNVFGTTGAAVIQSSGSGALVINSGTITAATAGTKSLILGGTNTSLNDFQSALPGANLANLTKLDSGTWQLSVGVNANTGPLSIAGGTLQVLANAAATSTNLSDSSNLVFAQDGLLTLALLKGNGYAGGTFQYTANAAGSTEAMAVLTTNVNGGAGTVRIVTGGGGNAQLTFSGLSLALGTGLNYENSGAGINGTNFHLNVTGLASGFVGARAYFNGADFAFNDTTQGVGSSFWRAPIYGDGLGDGGSSDAGFVTSASTLTAGLHNEITDNASSGAVAVNSLRINGAQTLTMTGLLTVGGATGGGILQTGGNGEITGTGVTTASAGDLVVRVDTGSQLTLSAPITATTLGGLTKNGAGTLVIGAANAQTGATNLNEGMVQLTTGGALSAAGQSLFLRQGAMLDLNGVDTGTAIGAFSGAGTVTNTSTTLATLSFGNTLTTNAIAGVFSGTLQDGGVGKQLAVTVTTNLNTAAQTTTFALTGLNTYTGPTTLLKTTANGALVLQVNSLADIGVASSIGAGDVSNNAGSLVFNGGILQYTGSNANIYQETQTPSISINRLFTLAGNGAIDSSGQFGNNILAVGAANHAALIFNNSANAVAFAGASGLRTLTLQGNSQGDNEMGIQLLDGGSHTLGITKTGTGLWVLSNPVNSYSGATTINQGILRAQDANSNAIATTTLAAGTSTTDLWVSSADGLTIGQAVTGAGIPVGTTVAAILDPMHIRLSLAATVSNGAPLSFGSINSLSASSNLIFTNATAGNDAVLEANGTFTRTIGPGAGQVQWGVNQHGGFAASSSPLVVNFGGANAQVSFGTGGIGNGTGLLYLNSATALSDVTVSNPINLNGGVRTVQVNDNTTTTTDFAILSGVISGGAGSGLNKTGAGTLYITGANTYSGNTTLTAGNLFVSSLGGGSTAASSLGDGTGQLNMSGGVLFYTGGGETSSRRVNLNGAATISVNGGALVLANVVNNTSGAKTLTLRGYGGVLNEIQSNLADNGGALTITTAGGGNPNWILSGNNTFTGNINVGGDTALGLATSASAGAASGAIILGNSGLFAAGSTPLVISRTIQLTGNSNSLFFGNQSITGNFSGIDTGGSAGTVWNVFNNITNGGTLTFSFVNNDNTSGELHPLQILGAGTTVITGVIANGASGSITGLTMQGSSSASLTITGGGPNTYGSSTLGSVLTQGTLILDKVTALGTAAAPVVLNGGVLQVGTTVGDLTGANKLTNAITLGGQQVIIGGAQSLEFGGLVTISAARTLINNITGAGKQLTLSGGIAGGFVLTLGGSGATLINSTFPTASGGITYSGSGTLGLTGIIAYTGATVINGGTTTLSTSGGQLSGTSGITVNNGATLTLDNLTVSGGNASANRLGNKPLTLAGATFNLQGDSSGTTEGTAGSAGNLTINSGQSVINVVNNGGNNVLNFGTLTFATTGASVDFTGGVGVTSNKVIFGTAPSLLPVTTGILAKATVAGVDFATYDTTLGIKAFSTYNAGSAYTDINAAGATDTIKVGTGFVTADDIASSRTINALVIQDSGLNVGMIGAANGTLTLTSGGILATGGTNTLSTARIAFGAAATEGVIHVGPGSTLNLSGTILGAQTGGVTKALGGNLNINAQQFYTGTTTLNGGTTRLVLNGLNTLFQNGTLSLNNGATLDLRGGTQFVGSLNSGGGGTIPGAGGTITTGSGTGTFVTNTSAAGTFAGQITGNINFVRLNSGSAAALTLESAQTYTGATILMGGTTTLQDSATLLGTSSIDVNYATLTISNSTGLQTYISDRVSDTAPVTLRGGTITYTGRVQINATETMGAVSLAQGANTITASHGNSGQYYSADLTFASLARSSGTTLNFTSGAGTLGQEGNNTRIYFTTAPAVLGGSGLLGAWAIANSGDYAAYNAGFGVGAMGTSGFASYNNQTIALDSTAPLIGSFASGNVTNLLATATGSTLLSASTTTTGLLRLGGAFTNDVTFSAAGNVLNLEQGGILRSNNNNASSIGTVAARGILTSGTSEFVVYNAANTTGATVMTINSIIQGAGTTFVKSGAGVLALTAPNTYDNGTVVNQGTLELRGTTTGDVVIPLGGLTLNNANVTMFVTATTNPVGQGQIAAGNNVVLNGNSFLTLVGANTLNSITFNNNGSSQNTVPTVATGGILTLSSSTPITVTSSNAATLPTISGAIAIGAGTNIFNIGAIQAGGVTYTNISPALSISAIISNATTAAGISKTGNGLLQLSGANTYTGGTTVTAGGLILAADSVGSAVGSIVTTGPVGTGALVMSSGTSLLTNNSNRLIANAVTLGNTMTFDSTGNTALTLSLNGVNTLPGSGAVVFNIPNAAVTVALAGRNAAGSLASISSFTKNGLGNLSMNFTGISSTAPISINGGGTLSLLHDGDGTGSTTTINLGAISYDAALPTITIGRATGTIALNKTIAPASFTAAGLANGMTLTNNNGYGLILPASTSIALNANLGTAGAVFSVGTASASNLVQGLTLNVGSSRVDLQACKLEYSIVSPK